MKRKTCLLSMCSEEREEIVWCLCVFFLLRLRFLDLELLAPSLSIISSCSHVSLLVLEAKTMSTIAGDSIAGHLTGSWMKDERQQRRDGGSIRYSTDNRKTAVKQQQNMGTKGLKGSLISQCGLIIVCLHVCPTTCPMNRSAFRQ